MKGGWLVASGSYAGLLEASDDFRAMGRAMDAEPAPTEDGHPPSRWR